jgi:hypothetical protein
VTVNGLYDRIVDLGRPDISQELRHVVTSIIERRPPWLRIRITTAFATPFRKATHRLAQLDHPSRYRFGNPIDERSHWVEIPNEQRLHEPTECS